MKAIVLNQAGGIENLFTSNIDKPVIDVNEVLIKTKALSVNPVDVKVKYAEEGLNAIVSEQRPVILGWDVAGTVSEIGSAVTNFKVGDNVFGMINFPGHGKGYAEYVAAPQEHIAKIPQGLSFADAAASSLAALTALQVLKNSVNEGDTVLIHAGSGGVGHFAIQVAKHFGAKVVSTSSAKNRDFILSIGADEHIDYREQDFEDVLSNVDFVFDTLGGKTTEKSLRVLRPGGKLTSIALMEVTPALQTQASELGVEMNCILVHSNQEDIQTISQLLASKVIIPHVSQSFGFDQIGKAHEAIESGRSVGKVVIKF